MMVTYPIKCVFGCAEKLKPINPNRTIFEDPIYEPITMSTTNDGNRKQTCGKCKKTFYAPDYYEVNSYGKIVKNIS